MPCIISDLGGLGGELRNVAIYLKWNLSIIQ